MPLFLIKAQQSAIFFDNNTNKCLLTYFYSPTSLCEKQYLGAVFFNKGKCPVDKHIRP